MVWHDSPAEFDAIGALDHQRQGSAGYGVALAVAQQCREVDNLIGAIDAAFGIDEGVGACRHRPPRNAAIREIERVGFQAEERVVGFLAANR